ncbi:MAG: glycerol-3-phosphate acyltransferase [bacterium]|nr:glycerol-3-phosphate acyltransferase [bacterium]MDE0667603.1 glycerol-3-phosphate acyltransferase [bacterium]MXZ30766.1 glycerol-3-phosphate acyltransferase [Acidimicrobiia bacterium]MYB24732.1 glycerol-3-phosphate acyltransferase [Acidimicrobiia bacterium]MYJ14942.1 glycerol-3-phosphate acyltransferase [Acidimicrobiia bacterium]
MSAWWLLVPLAYLLGTFPTAHLVGRLVGHDPMNEGSCNPGATNMYRVAGRGAGALVLLGDLIKGLAPTLVALLLAGRPVAMGCAVAAVLGHIAPLTRRLRGGKGVATYGGASLAMWSFAALGAVVLFLVITKWSGRPSVGSLVAVPLLPVGVGIQVVFGSVGWWEPVLLSAVAMVIVGMHWRNIVRLSRGEEARLPNVFTRRRATTL